MVCDRPNPISGDRIVGNPLDLQFASFLGVVSCRSGMG
ncbi:hypothetical protein [Pseudalkalibacillus salsuginis]